MRDGFFFIGIVIGYIFREIPDFILTEGHIPLPQPARMNLIIPGCLHTHSITFRRIRPNRLTHRIKRAR